MHITMEVDGKQCHADVEGSQRLIEFLRDHTREKSVKSGCVTASCGSCTVLLDGQSVRSCTVTAGQADGCSVATVRSAQHDPLLSAIQQAFIDSHATQCGFCAPGMVIAVRSLLAEEKELTEDDVRQGLRGNVCRCVGYPAILRAIRSLAPATAAGAGDVVDEEESTA
ncbi:(2Fe-2S)-binding protein [Streptomyces sp. SAS_267]|uniref:(2Fe-2S)-binding protein n=1 Tax=Streptomyces sp. SAS_267 TaxID=3412750 RepID=UPI00403CA297